MSTPDADSGTPADEPRDTSPQQKEKQGKPKKSKRNKGERTGGIFARLALFLRQVVDELRKVIWPTRSELINYTTVVVVFVVIMALILAVYDFAFARAVFFVFGN